MLVARALRKAGADPALAAGEAAQLLSAFKDKAEIPGWAAGDVASAVKAGVVKGMPDGAFAPLSQASRAEATVMLKRMLSNMNLV
ncbi:MAG: S-layer homology domain-containing protein [Bacillota bacterium]